MKSLPQSILKGVHPAHRRHHERLYEVMRVLRKVSSITDLAALLDLILRSAQKTMRAEASSLMLLDHAKNELYFQQVRGGNEDVKELRLKVGQGIAGRVAQTGRAMIVNDTRSCPYFYRGADKATGFVSRQILCVPMTVKKTVIGVIEVLNKTSGRFDREDLLLFSNFAGHAAVAIENARLYNLAAYDGLTQVFTRGHFDDWFGSEFSRIRRYRRPLTLMLLDIDDFKAINDNHGHQAGDYVLAVVARTIRDCLRASDIVGRYGGDEFVAALTETPADGAPVAAERIRGVVAAYPFEYEGRPIAVTVSLGLASFRDQPEASPSALLREADLALYEAKTLRNAVRCYGAI